MDAYFVDVGQGTCNVLDLGDGRAIVIDCGPRGAKLLPLLALCQVREIVRLIISHNDVDHSGGAAAVLAQYRNAIGQVWCVHDVRLRDTLFWQQVRDDLDDGYLSPNQLVRLEVEGDDQPRLIYESGALTVKLLAPSYATNLLAHDKKSSNYTSGIVVLQAGGRCAVYPGDAGIAAWERVFAARKKPLECDILSVPHHGGKTGSPKQITWTYTHAVIPRFAVLSVGSTNRHHHPRTDVVSALKAAGASVLCTQITRRCCGNLEAFQRINEGATDPVGSPLESPGPAHAQGRGVPCAGTLHVRINDQEMNVQRLQEHQARVHELNTLAELHGHPMCHRAAGGLPPVASGTAASPITIAPLPQARSTSSAARKKRGR